MTYKNIISEIRKAEKILGKSDKISEIGHIGALNYIKKNLSKPINSRYGITMTSIPKVGINPSSRYDTPIGIYFYPIEYYMETVNLGNRLPFVHDSKYINVLEFTESSKILLISEIEITKFNKIIDDLKLLHKEFPNLDEQLKEDYLDFIYDSIEGSHYNANVKSKIGGRLWYVFWRLSKFLSDNSESIFSTKTKSSVIWNWLLRKLGYSIVLDLGDGIIHENEPTQGFAVTKNAIKWIKTIENIDNRNIEKKKLNIQLFNPENSKEDLIYNLKYIVKASHIIYKRIDYFTKLINKFNDSEVTKTFVTLYPYASLEINISDSDLLDIMESKGFDTEKIYPKRIEDYLHKTIEKLDDSIEFIETVFKTKPIINQYNKLASDKLLMFLLSKNFLNRHYFIRSYAERITEKFVIGFLNNYSDSYGFRLVESLPINYPITSSIIINYLDVVEENLGKIDRIRYLKSLELNYRLKYIKPALIELLESGALYKEESQYIKTILNDKFN